MVPKKIENSANVYCTKLCATEKHELAWVQIRKKGIIPVIPDSGLWLYLFQSEFASKDTIQSISFNICMRIKTNYCNILNQYL